LCFDFFNEDVGGFSFLLVGLEPGIEMGEDSSLDFFFVSTVGGVVFVTLRNSSSEGLILGVL
jgi:hypothetical protein